MVLDSDRQESEHNENIRVVRIMQINPARVERLAALRAEVRAIESCGSADGEVLPFGIAPIDERLAAGGLDAAALHEIAAEAPDLSDDAAATLFAAGISARRAGPAPWAL